MTEVIQVADTGFSLEGPKEADNAVEQTESNSRAMETEARRAKASLARDVMSSVRQVSREQQRGTGQSAVCTADMTTEERSRWQSLILTLSRYGASRRFGELLRSYGFTLSASALRRLGVDELEDVLDRVRMCFQQATVEGMFSQAALAAVGFVESAVVSTPALRKRMLLSGLTDSLRQDEGFMSALEQLSIDMGSFVACPPEYRLMMAFTAAAGRTHAMNLFMKKRAGMVARAEVDSKKDAPATKEAAPPKDKDVETE